VLRQPDGVSVYIRTEDLPNAVPERHGNTKLRFMDYGTVKSGT
jgi:hypothetical protein